jgi:serine protease AprX
MVIGRRNIAICCALLATFALARPEAQHAPKQTHADRAKLDRALRGDIGTPRGAFVRVIVRTRPSARDIVRGRVATHGDSIVADHPSIDAFAAVVHRGDVDALAADPDVEGVSADAIVTAHQSKTSALVATELPGGGPSGSSSRIAIIDSGLEPTADLGGGRVIGFYDFTRGSVSSLPPYDDFGHGTHVAGLIAGNGSNSGGLFRGLAPSARVLVLKVLDRNGAGYTSSVIEAIDFILANQKTFAIDVINLSLGHPVLESAETDPLVLEVEKATRAGIVVVAAAGNYGQDPVTGAVGYGGITSPGNAPSAITVGCVDTQMSVGRGDDSVCAYSSRGPTAYDGYAKPDIVVAGHQLVSIAALQSTLYQSYPDLRVTGKIGDVPRYLRLSGTSMATAVATGGIAVLLDSLGGDKRFYTPNLIKALLQWTAIPIAGADALTQGAGSANFAGALALSHRIDPDVPIGGRWLTAPVTPSTTIGGIASPWAQTLAWGNTPGTGSLVELAQSAWVSKTVVWGNAADWSGNVTWGADIVWSNSATWSSNLVSGDAVATTVDGTSKTVVWGNSKERPTVVWGNSVQP